MTEKTTLEIIAPTVEEAIAQGLAQLGLTADAVSVEVLDAGNKGLFGLGKPQVRVRLTVVPEGGMNVVEPEPKIEPKPKKEPKRVEPKPQPVVDTPRQNAPSTPIVAAESQPEHDPLLDHTEAVGSAGVRALWCRGT